MLRKVADNVLTMLRALFVLWIGIGMTGCAALTNPVADGIPVCDLAPELLAPSKQGEEPIPISLLGQKPPSEYLLDTGDVLGVWIEGVMDDKIQIPQTRVLDKTRRVPERSDVPSTIGYPVAVRPNGTVSLPLINPVTVRGMTVEQADAAIRQAYIADKIIQPGRGRGFVALQHKRLYQVVVFRHDLEVQGGLNTNMLVTNVGSSDNGTFLLGKGTTGAGHQIDLPAYENDLVHALALTGGFPGANAAGEVVIFRKMTLTVRGQAPDAEERQTRGAGVGVPRVVGWGRADAAQDKQPSGGAGFGLPREASGTSAADKDMQSSGGAGFGLPRPVPTEKMPSGEEMQPNNGAGFGTPRDASARKMPAGADVQPKGDAGFGLPRDLAPSDAEETTSTQPRGAEFGTPRGAPMPSPKLGLGFGLPAPKLPMLPDMTLPPVHFGEPGAAKPQAKDVLPALKDTLPDPFGPELEATKPKGPAPVLKSEPLEPAGPGVGGPTLKDFDRVLKDQAPQVLPTPRASLERDVVIRIPLRTKRGQPLTINPGDIQLQSGDVVLVEAAPIEKFYTGGLLPTGEYLLPRDYDLDVLEAVSRVRGPLINGAFGGSNLSGTLIRPGIGGPSPRQLSVVRQTPDGGQVTINVDLFCALRDPRERLLIKSGDMLILQESRRQALSRYFTEQFNVLATFRIFNHSDATGIAGFVLP